MTRVLLIGNGAREHAIAEAIRCSRREPRLYSFMKTNNPGIASLSEEIRIGRYDDLDAIIAFARETDVAFAIVGPEDPLSQGVVDALAASGIPAMGPTRSLARLETSKSFTRNLLEKYGIPGNPRFRNFRSSEGIEAFFDELNGIVLKPDGLTGGKGVMVQGDHFRTRAEALDLCRDILRKHPGVTVEERLEGEEFSLQCLCDGRTVVATPPVQDHKRRFEDDRGPNTGGMGAYAPVPLVDEPLYARAKKEIFDNFLDGIKNEKLTFRGIIYAGIMVTQDGPKVLEFNVRFGDPETEVVLPLLDTDITELFEASVKGELDRVKIAWSKKSCVCVVISSGGYPDKYEKGLEISGLTDVRGDGNVIVFHAGTKKENDRILTSGGRVLGVTGLGNSLKTAIKTVYKGVEKIKFSRMYYRKDIGAKGLRRGI